MIGEVSRAGNDVWDESAAAWDGGDSHFHLCSGFAIRANPGRGRYVRRRRVRTRQFPVCLGIVGAA